MVDTPAVWRVTRAAIFGLAAVLLAATAHVAAGGQAPGVATVATALLVCCCVAYGLARKSRTARSILPVLGVLELMLHQVFMYGAATGCSGPAGSSMVMPGMPGTGRFPVATCASMEMTHNCAWMVVAHAAATVATALLLAHGERTARALWVLVARRTVVARTTLPVAATVLVPRTDVAGAVSRLAHVEFARRGPPRTLGVV